MKLVSLSLVVTMLLVVVVGMTHAFVVVPTTTTLTQQSSPAFAARRQPCMLLHSTTNDAASAASSLTDDDKEEVDVTAILANLKQLLEHLKDGNDGGAKLLAASSAKWQAAIQAAVGAPDTANDGLVAQALQDSMARPHNQFAILMGTEKDGGSNFEAIFPTDPVVDADTKAVWVECQLRTSAPADDELLVTMGISLVNDGDSDNYKIDELQWQDFRDAYYPGLSGREWLRAF